MAFVYFSCALLCQRVFSLPTKGRTFYAKLSSWFNGRLKTGAKLYGGNFPRLFVKGTIVKVDEAKGEALISFPGRFEAHWRKASYFQGDFIRSTLTGKKMELSQKEFLDREGEQL